MLINHRSICLFFWCCYFKVSFLIKTKMMRRSCARLVGASSASSTSSSSHPSSRGVSAAVSTSGTTTTTSASADLVATTLSQIGTTDPFIRSLPPDSYITYDPVTGWRHLCIMVDATTQYVGGKSFCCMHNASKEVSLAAHSSSSSSGW
ncbi:Hypothetical protein, putative [Bodo saltans]|uniref:Uncharacterized protein n=1 Tax=Bodo saltans TaxID=75058 RepID=A0A0S4JNZ5_BODSA|nr:Hypothetical protein, putative [Bodo saltans]|eukprot:CUG90232.1 Hypothetical protein, putative [Bodo saltans]